MTKDYLNEHMNLQVFLSLLPAMIVCFFIQFYDTGVLNRVRDLRYNDRVVEQYASQGTLLKAEKTSDGKLLVRARGHKLMTVKSGSHLCSVVCGDLMTTKLYFDDLTSMDMINFDLIKNPESASLKYSFVINGRTFVFSQGEKMFDIYLDEPDGYRIVMGMESFHVDSILGISRNTEDDGRVKLTIDPSFVVEDEDSTLYFIGYTHSLPDNGTYVDSDNLSIWKPVTWKLPVRFIMATGLPIFALAALAFGFVFLRCHKKNDLEFMSRKEPFIVNFAAAAALIVLAVETFFVLR